MGATCTRVLIEEARLREGAGEKREPEGGLDRWKERLRVRDVDDLEAAHRAEQRFGGVEEAHEPPRVRQAFVEKRKAERRVSGTVSVNKRDGKCCQERVQSSMVVLNEFSGDSSNLLEEMDKIGLGREIVILFVREHVVAR